MSHTVSRRTALNLLGLSVCSPIFSKIAHAQTDEWVLGFGSCMSQRRRQGFWNTLLTRTFNHWVFLGDNLYPDRDTYSGLTEAYAELAECKPLKEFMAKVPVNATWDDHDFGADNADSRLPFRAASLGLFKNFWKQDYASRSDGVYSSQMFTHQGRKIQLIVLDLRYNRTPHHADESLTTPDSEEFKETSVPQMLGEEQWVWLEAEMKKSADLKIIGSSIQVLSSDHAFEKWKNYPAEFDRLMEAVGRSDAPTVFLSGDRHVHEISKLQLVSGRTLYDFTSSGLNKADGLSRFERNRLRVDRCLDDGFGELRVSWNGSIPLVSMQMVDDKGNVRFAVSDSLV